MIRLYRWSRHRNVSRGELLEFRVSSYRDADVLDRELRVFARTVYRAARRIEGLSRNVARELTIGRLVAHWSVLGPVRVERLVVVSSSAPTFPPGVDVLSGEDALVGHGVPVRSVPDPNPGGVA